MNERFVLPQQEPRGSELWKGHAFYVLKNVSRQNSSSVMPPMASFVVGGVEHPSSALEGGGTATTDAGSERMKELGIERVCISIRRF